MRDRERESSKKKNKNKNRQKYISTFSRTLLIRFICLAAHYKNGKHMHLRYDVNKKKIWNSSVLTILTPGTRDPRNGTVKTKKRTKQKNERTFYFISSFPSGVEHNELKTGNQSTSNKECALYVWRIEYISIYTIWFDAEYCVLSLSALSSQAHSSGNGYDIRKCSMFQEE